MAIHIPTECPITRPNGQTIRPSRRKDPPVAKLHPAGIAPTIPAPNDSSAPATPPSPIHRPLNRRPEQNAPYPEPDIYTYINIKPAPATVHRSAPHRPSHKPTAGARLPFPEQPGTARIPRKHRRPKQSAPDTDKRNGGTPKSAAAHNVERTTTANRRCSPDWDATR